MKFSVSIDVVVNYVYNSSNKFEIPARIPPKKVTTCTSGVLSSPLVFIVPFS